MHSRSRGEGDGGKPPSALCNLVKLLACEDAFMLSGEKEGEYEGRADQACEYADEAGQNTEQQTNEPEQDLHTDQPGKAVKVKGEDKPGPTDGAGEEECSHIIQEGVVKNERRNRHKDTAGRNHSRAKKAECRANA